MRSGFFNGRRESVQGYYFRALPTFGGGVGVGTFGAEDVCLSAQGPFTEELIHEHIAEQKGEAIEGDSQSVIDDDTMLSPSRR